MTEETWYPDAKVYKMPSRGYYAARFPVGAVIHYTAGRNNALSTMKGGADKGHAYFCINREGDVYQGLPMEQWGYHAGASFWPNLGEHLSTQLVGIELCASGNLFFDTPNFKTWYGEVVPKEEVRTISGRKDWGEDSNYHIYTPAQEKALFKLMIWMKSKRPDIFMFENVVGHHECCDPPGRKSDPGGALSMPMQDFRNRLETIWQQDRGLAEYISLP